MIFKFLWLLMILWRKKILKLFWSSLPCLQSRNTISLYKDDSKFCEGISLEPFSLSDVVWPRVIWEQFFQQPLVSPELSYLWVRNILRILPKKKERDKCHIITTRFIKYVFISRRFPGCRTKNEITFPRNRPRSYFLWVGLDSSFMTSGISFWSAVLVFELILNGLSSNCI